MMEDAWRMGSWRMGSGFTSSQNMEDGVRLHKFTKYKKI